LIILSFLASNASSSSSEATRALAATLEPSSAIKRTRSKDSFRSTARIVEPLTKVARPEESVVRSTRINALAAGAALKVIVALFDATV
jgi:hypothetical protein